MRICYVEGRKSDAGVSETSDDEPSLAEAIAHAGAWIRNIRQTPPPGWSSDIIGFVIYDDAGQELHRHYMEGK